MFYTKPTRNTKPVYIQQLSKYSKSGGTGGITKNEREINLWSLDINEIILNHMIIIEALSWVTNCKKLQMKKNI